MAGSVAAGLEQSDAGEEFGVAVDEAIAQRVVVPMRASDGEARVAVEGQGVVFALDNELGVRERVMVASVVDVEMRADENVDVPRAYIELGEMLEDVFFIGGGRRGRKRGVGSHS